MATSTVENYVKQIFLQQQSCGKKLVSLGRLAGAMNVVPGTVTTMVKTLAESGLLKYQPRRGVHLTAAGEKLALHVLRRHRLIELFLVRALGFDSSEVHDEAEELEHAISEKLLERIDEFLGRPAFDPHGDPIPTPGGKLAPSPATPLVASTVGLACRIARIADQDPQFLKYVNTHGLIPGAAVSVLARDAVGEAIIVQVADRAPLSLGASAAAKIFVESPGKGVQNQRKRTRA